MTAASRFQAFLDNIVPTSAQHDDARTKAAHVARTLGTHYYGDATTHGADRIIGSYGKGTAVRPPRDVDLLFQLPNELYGRYKNREGNGPSQLLQDVREILRERYSTTDKIRGDGHVVVISFTGGHNVELLPAWRTTSGRYLVPDTHDGGSWALVDQTAEMVNVDASNLLTGGITRHLIRILKVWQHECAVQIKSLTLELHAIDCLRGLEASFDADDLPELVRTCFELLVKRAGHVAPMPGTTEPFEYGESWLGKAESAANRSARACDFELSGDERGAATEWRRIFGNQYEF